MWVVMQTEKGGKWYAFAHRFSESENMIPFFEREKVKTANYCRTKKEAFEMAEHFNDCHKRNGNYLFDEPKF